MTLGPPPPGLPMGGIRRGVADPSADRRGRVHDEGRDQGVGPLAGEKCVESSPAVARNGHL